MSTLSQWLAPPPDLDALENLQAAVRPGLIIVALLAAGLIGWICFAPLSAAIIASGIVKVELNRQTLQHQEGGIIRQILVRDGDKVEAGQSLIVLRDVRVNATYELLRSQLDSALARAARLDGERIGAAVVIFPAELLSRSGDAGVEDLLSRERTLFSVRRDAIEQEIQLIRDQLHETQDEVVARARQVDADTHALSLQQEELSANEALLEQGYVSKTRLLALKRALADYQARVADNAAESSRARQRIAELNLKAASLRHSRMQEAAEEHKKVTAQVLDFQERVRASEDAEARQIITAPAAGEVVGLRFTTEGAVIGPREPILDLVPRDRALLIEARIRPEDINYVRSGAAADLRLLAFKQRITPIVVGTVTYVSADRLEDQATHLAYYLAQIKVEPKQLRDAGDIKLRAGMPVEVFVKTHDRTVLQYMLEPVTNYLRRALREP